MLMAERNLRPVKIQQLLSGLLQRPAFDDLDQVFTPDAYIDYRALASTAGIRIKQ